MTNVDFVKCEKRFKEWTVFRLFVFQWINHWPRKSSTFHVIGEGDIVAPNVELPFSKSHYAAQHVTRVYANSHVDIESSRFPNESVTR